MGSGFALGFDLSSGAALGSGLDDIVLPWAQVHLWALACVLVQHLALAWALV